MTLPDPAGGDLPPQSPGEGSPPPHEIRVASPVVVHVHTGEKAPAGPPPRKLLIVLGIAWKGLVQILPLIQALAILWIGYDLTGKVTNAIQRRQLELNNVKEMQSLLGRLYERQSPETLAATVSALTAFRDYAVPPLTGLLQSPEPNQRTAAEAGLRTLALSDSAAVARQLLRIVGSRNRICSWRMLQSSVRLVGDLGCQEALPALRDLQRRISMEDRARAADVLGSMTNPDAPPDTTNVDDLRDVLETAISQLEPPGSGGVAP